MKTRALGLLGLLLLAVACGPGEARSRIDFSVLEATDAESQPAPPRSDIIRMAVAPVLSPLPTFSLYQELLEYLGRKLGTPVALVQGKTYAEINDLVRSGDVTLAFVCTNPYVQGQEEFGMELLVAPEVAGAASYYSLLIVRRDLPDASLRELRGRTFAFSDPLSNSGRLVPLYQLALLGETPERFFSRSIFTYSHDRSVRAVAEGIVDGAAVDSLVYDYMARTEPEVVAKTRVIERWGPFGINPVVVNPRLDPNLKARLRDLLLAMGRDPEGKAILQKLMVDRFVVPDDQIYDPVREMRAYLRQRGLER
ncbi:MAG TPA: phosphate/phosphite/phosphonate ABC transporter substrate-binding protein [Dehalococcoidia bacterium]|nr:phosphate/phosphite/phosphonate ABC transporter substrate-binding protein [Dehalococcoidia bacterium]